MPRCIKKRGPAVFPGKPPSHSPTPQDKVADGNGIRWSGIKDLQDHKTNVAIFDE